MPVVRVTPRHRRANRSFGRARLGLLCLLTLVSVGGLLASGEILLRHVVRQQTADARIINLAGRQRMLSQRLAKAALAATLLPDAGTRRLHARELRETARRLARTHRGLQRGDAALGLPGDNAVVIRRRLARLDADVAELVGGAHAVLAAVERRETAGDSTRRILASATTFERGMDQIVDLLGADARVLRTEPRFLRRMNRVVALYEREARGRVTALAHNQTVFLVLALATIVLLVFSPAVHVLRDSIAAEAQLRRELLDVSMREQQRIGQDLHDGLGQELTGISLMAQVLARRLRDRGMPEAEHAGRIEALVSDAVRRTRTLALALSPVDVEQGDLVAALRSLAAYVRTVFGVECEVRGRTRVDGADPATALHLYRIAQEAVTNAVRHGKATHVTIEVGGTGRDGTLAVVDDGAGFVSTAIEPGMGLHTMRQRASAVRGALEVQSAAGRGTTVRSTFRLEEAVG